MARKLPIVIDSPADLEPIGQAADLLGMALTLVDEKMRVHWRNGVAAEWFGEAPLPDSHCYAWHWGQSARCRDCLALRVFQSSQQAEGLRVMGRPGQARRPFRVQALPVVARAGGATWALETMVPLEQLARYLAARPELEGALEEGAGQSASITRHALEAERIERQMVRSEKLAAVGSLAAGLAHEIGTPLNVISATAEYLMLDQPPGAEARRELAAIVEETERIGGLVRELLAFAREAPAARTRVQLAEVVDRTVSLMRIPVEKKGITLEAQVPADLPELMADPHGLHQILVNVLLNALDAVREGGRIRIEAHGNATRGVVVELHDSGPGIPIELRERVFDPFFTTRADGTGLGLAVCARIVQAHGGDLRVTDSPLGGACFVLHLPACEAEGP